MQLQNSMSNLDGNYISSCIYKNKKENGSESSGSENSSHELDANCWGGGGWLILASPPPPPSFTVIVLFSSISFELCCSVNFSFLVYNVCVSISDTLSHASCARPPKGWCCYTFWFHDVISLSYLLKYISYHCIGIIWYHFKAVLFCYLPVKWH